MFKNLKTAKHLGSEMRNDMVVVTAEIVADVGIRHSSNLPSAIEMLEALPRESSLGLIAENQVGLGQRRVPAQVPGLADLEVAEHVQRHV